MDDEERIAWSAIGFGVGYGISQIGKRVRQNPKVKKKAKPAPKVWSMDDFDVWASRYGGLVIQANDFPDDPNANPDDYFWSVDDELVFTKYNDSVQHRRYKLIATADSGDVYTDLPMPEKLIKLKNEESNWPSGYLDATMFLLSYGALNIAKDYMAKQEEQFLEEARFDELAREHDRTLDLTENPKIKKKSIGRKTMWWDDFNWFYNVKDEDYGEMYGKPKRDSFFDGKSDWVKVYSVYDDDMPEGTPPPAIHFTMNGIDGERFNLDYNIKAETVFDKYITDGNDDFDDFIDSIQDDLVDNFDIFLTAVDFPIPSRKNPKIKKKARPRRIVGWWDNFIWNVETNENNYGRGEATGEPDEDSPFNSIIREVSIDDFDDFLRFEFMSENFEIIVRLDYWIRSGDFMLKTIPSYRKLTEEQAEAINDMVDELQDRDGEGMLEFLVDIDFPMRMI